MMEAKFKIGDRVRYLGEFTGVVSDILERKATSSFLYEVTRDGREKPSNFLLKEEDLELFCKEYSMQIQIDIAQNVVIATLYEITNGDTTAVVGKGHGHLIHDGELGIAQAASYACRRLYESLGGTYIKGGSQA